MSQLYSTYSIAEFVSSRTEPEAFFLDVFFNAHPIHNASDGKQKQKAPNALVPSVIAYAGGQMDFTVDMGPDVSRAQSLVVFIPQPPPWS